MKPKQADNHPDLFQLQLSQIINMSHPLVKLAHQINWDRIATQIDTVYTTGPGQPPLPTRLLAGLHYLKHAFDESDESVLARWLENPYWQYFCGYSFLQHQLPLHPTSLVKWRQRVGDKAEALLVETLKVAQESGAIQADEFHHINVDTTVQEKNITFPTDAKLYHKTRQVLVKAAQERNIPLRQSYARSGKKAFILNNRYRHARQYKRANKACKTLKNYLGRIIRELERKGSQTDQALQSLLDRARRIYRQQTGDTDKIYSWHETAVQCIGKGKAHKKYEFGNKVSLVSSSKNNWVLSAQGLANPYDGHTLADALAHMQQVCGHSPQHVYCDQGYRGHQQNGPDKPIIHLVGKIPKTASRSMKRWMKRRAAVEPIIGHLKADNRMGRNYLKGEAGNSLNPILAAAAYNLRKLLAWLYFWLMRWIVENRKSTILQG